MFVEIKQLSIERNHSSAHNQILPISGYYEMCIALNLGDCMVCHELTSTWDPSS